MEDTEKKIEDNPFAALFPSISQAQQFSSEKQQKLPEEKISVNVETKLAVSKLIEDIFLLTLEKDCDGRTESYVYLEDLAERMDGQTWMDIDTLSQAVFERLMLDSPQEFIKKPASKSLAGEPLVLPYLSQSYNRLIEYRQQQKSEPFSTCIKECKSVIILNAKTCLLQTELFPSQSLYQQFIDIYLQESGAVFGDDSGQIIDFFVQVMDSIDKDEDGNVEDVMIPVLDLVKAKFINMSLISAEKSQYIHLCKFFSKTAAMAEAFMKYNTPKDIKSGKQFESTLIGSMLSLSCIPKNEAGPYDFFNDPSSYRKHVHDNTESSIWAELVTLNEKIYLMVYSLIKVSPHIRHLVLKWLGKCLAANQGRTKIWSNQMPQLFNQLYSSEGFCLNLNYLMLKLCQPFCEPMSAKLLKIQCSYTQAVGKDEEDIKTRCIHAGGLTEETCLIPAGVENTPNNTETYNFITECFFLTQQCINLGFHTLHNKFTKLNQDLHRVQRLYQDVRHQSASEEVEPVRSIKAQMEKGMTLFLSMKAALTVPQLLEMSLNLHTSTATWLSQMAASDIVTEFKPITLPLPEMVPTSLSLIPEFVMGNLNDFISFLHRYQDELFEFAGDKVKYFMTLILVFMGNPERMNNPHLRAELAETLSSLMPPDPNQKAGGGLLAKFHREKLFSEHELIDHLAEKLLHVFVSIEMTGQSVEFEQKFNYRRPMYIVLEYIWEIDVHKQAIKNLSDIAERNVDAPEAPLFLRFINLLINDAIFLLDEALSYMMQIKEKQQEKERGEWDSQDQRQRQQTEANFRFMGNIARYHNVMANYTIHSLELLTREIKTIFCNFTMVDRIAAMLNYFLVHLVGPKQKNFNVKDKNDYEFKPQQIVSDITKIYLNLGDSDEFCQAVCNDGRSYSTDLFPKTVQVLQKIGSDPIMISDFLGLDDKIRCLNEKTQAEDDLVEDAPEEFLDPILGNLMRDPVLLPTSGTIIDRSVISRHILSDQTDPFNRAPLTMDMVVPQTDLKNKIAQWRQDKAKS